MVYLKSGGVDKEALARKIAAGRGVRKDGSICMFGAAELDRLSPPSSNMA